MVEFNLKAENEDTRGAILLKKETPNTAKETFYIPLPKSWHVFHKTINNSNVSGVVFSFSFSFCGNLKVLQGKCWEKWQQLFIFRKISNAIGKDP